MSLHDFSDRFPALCRRLLDLRRGGRLAHAYLLVGDDSDGLEAFARAWIATCVCQTPRADGEACGVCGACTDLAAKRYAEIYELRPESKGRFIQIGEDHLQPGVRRLDHQLSLATGEGRLKVGLIVDADRLTEQAQNAFLKTLEEPSGRVMLLLLTTSPRALLPTIRSRCQMLSVRRNRGDYAFAEGTGLFAHLAKLGRGAGAARALSAAAGLRAIFSSLHQKAAEAVPAADGEDSLADYDAAFRKRVEEARQAREQAEYLRLRGLILEAIQVWFQQRLLMASGASGTELAEPGLAPAEGYGPVATPEEAGADVREAADLERYLAGNVDERLAVEAFCLAVCRVVS
ncbi:MAG: DNA polymerase III subunit tau [Lentisphaerae bacterium ADurb.BinA184]|nr:MAG: DNA polymerase III subunit tau [Lentisphaerae bacterium ADurb.BinA184]